MTRSFLAQPVDAAVIDDCIDLATRAPSAGRTQGWHLLVWHGEETSRYWDIALPESQRDGFAFPGLMNADVVMLSMTDKESYLERYREPDKRHTDLGESLSKWPAPFWTIDASFATMTLLMAVHDAGLGALFFAHAHEEELRERFGIPAHVEILGTVAIGHRDTGTTRRGRSADRPRRTSSEVIHRSVW